MYSIFCICGEQNEQLIEQAEELLKEPATKMIIDGYLSVLYVLLVHQSAALKAGAVKLRTQKALHVKMNCLRCGLCFYSLLTLKHAFIATADIFRRLSYDCTRI